MVSHRSKHIAPKTWLSRREFLKLAAFGLGSLSVGLPSVGAPTLRPWSDLQALPDFPLAERLGRVAVGMVDLKMRPDPESPTLGVLYEDAVIAWLREAAGARPNPIFNSQRWVETPKGYIYSPYLQPVYNHPNQPVDTLPTSTRGPGMWVEVTVPYAEAALDKDEPSSNSWAEVKIEQGLPLRVYYGQTFWVDQIRADSQGKALYRINPNYYGGVDMLWAAAEAFRPITTDDLRPIHPDAVEKRIVVDVTHQTLSCFEGQSEVYFCQVSTGAKYDMYGNPVDEWATPLGHHVVERKYISLQMSGGTTGAGYDLPGIAWTNVFAIGGVAIHATFWHHNYGTPVSHGCVNCTPEDALWIFRWTVPEVVYDPGMVDVTVTGQESTSVDVIEA